MDIIKLKHLSWEKVLKEKEYKALKKYMNNKYGENNNETNTKEEDRRQIG